MYIILTGMFFICILAVIDLLHHRKKEKMMKAEVILNHVSLADYPQLLIEGCRKGDHKSQLQIYKLYYRQVYVNCLKMSDNPARAENLMHESFFEAFENIGSYSGDTGFDSWLLKFIKNNL
jgi:hypothetical protein